MKQSQDDCDKEGQARNMALGRWMAVLGTIILIIGMINAVRQKNTV